MNSLTKKLFLLAICCKLTAVANAKMEGVLNQLLAPGPLMYGHENLEHKQCLKCHEVAGGIPDKNCLKCHKEIAKHRRSGKHFTGAIEKNA